MHKVSAFVPKIQTIILLLLISTDAEPSYFNYTADCPTECVAIRESCTIHEINRDSFEKMCYMADGFCVEMASPVIVCLRPKHEPKGGSPAEWTDYKAKFYPEPHPKPVIDKTLLWTIVPVAFVIGLLSGALALHGSQRLRRRSLQQDEERRPLIGPTEEGVYRTTVEPTGTTHEGRV